jgi:hypothetical protein
LDGSPELRSEPLFDAEGNVPSDLSLKKYLMKGDAEGVDMPVDNKPGLINSRCSDLSRPGGKQLCHRLLPISGDTVTKELVAVMRPPSAKLCCHLFFEGRVGKSQQPARPLFLIDPPITGLPFAVASR